MMENKYIRADLFLNKIAESAFFSAVEKAKVRVAIEKEPGEDINPVAHAHWIKGAFADITCSNCGFPIVLPDSLIPKFAYCPNCGAVMDTSDKSKDKR